MQLLSLGSQAILFEVFLQERKGDVNALFAGHECCIYSPIHARNRSGNEARFKTGKLVDESKPVILFDHPLHVGRCSCRVCEIQWNSNLGKHLRQAGVRGGMQLWITEDFDARSGFMNIN